MPAKIGFRFIPFPQEIVDEGLKLTLGEYRLLGYLLRHRVNASGNVAVQLSQNELIEGRLRPDGTRYDSGCGLTSGRDIKAAREQLQQRGWLECWDTRNGMIYRILIENDEPSVSAERTDAKVQDVNLEDSQPVQDVGSDSAERHQQNIKELDVLEENLFPLEAGVQRASEVKGPDPRHTVFKELIFRFYRWKWRRDPGWDGSDAAQLSKVLKANPSLSAETFAHWLRNYGESKDITPGERPRRFLPRIENYSVRPLNSFGRDGSTGNGKASQAEERNQRITDRVKRYAATQGISVDQNRRSGAGDSEGAE